MKKTINKYIGIFIIILAFMFSVAVPTYASGKINKTNVTICTGQKVQLKVSGEKGKKKWKSSNKKIAAVNSKGKVTGKKKGTACVTVTAGKNTYSCNVTVEAPKMNKSSITISKGQTYSLAMNNTVQKYKWSSKKKSIATVTQDGKVTGKKAGTTYIYAKSASGKSFKCKVKVSKKTYVATTPVQKPIQNTPLAGNGVTYTSSATQRGAVAIAENHNAYTVSVSAKCTYYLKGKVVGSTGDLNSALEGKRKCVLEFYYTDTQWDSYKITTTVTRPESSIYGAFNVKNIRYTDKRENNRIRVNVLNAGIANDFTYISIVYYRAGKIVAFDFDYANVKNPGQSDVLVFWDPYELNSENNIAYDRYEVYVNYSYKFK